MAIVLLMIAMTLTVKVLGWIAHERRAADRRERAVVEVANLMERITAHRFEEVTPELARRADAFRARHGQSLPDPELAVLDGAGEGTGALAAKRIAIRLRWRGRSGEWEAPVRLTSWMHPRRKEIVKDKPATRSAPRHHDHRDTRGGHGGRHDARRLRGHDSALDAAECPSQDRHTAAVALDRLGRQLRDDVHGSEAPGCRCHGDAPEKTAGLRLQVAGDHVVTYELRRGQRRPQRDTSRQARPARVVFPAARPAARFLYREARVDTAGGPGREPAPRARAGPTRPDRWKSWHCRASTGRVPTANQGGSRDHSRQIAKPAPRDHGGRRARVLVIITFDERRPAYGSDWPSAISRTAERRLQAEWLVESGVVRPLARLDANRDYAGETWSLSPATSAYPRRGPAHRAAGKAGIGGGRDDRRRARARRGPPPPDPRPADYPRGAAHRARQSKDMTIELKPRKRRSRAMIPVPLRSGRHRPPRCTAECPPRRPSR